MIKILENINNDNLTLSESLSSEEKKIIHKLWLDNLEKVMGYSKQISDDLRNKKYGDDAYSDKTYDTWKSLLIKNGIDVLNVKRESKLDDREPIKLLKNNRGDHILVYKDKQTGRIRAKGDIAGDSFHGPWDDKHERYYNMKGFKEITESTNDINFLQGISIPGYVGKWSAFENYITPNGTYYIFEHDYYGDETCYLVCKVEEGKLVGDIYETFDDINTCLQDEGVVD